MRVELHSDLEGSIEGLPAFRCHLTRAGGWAFRCTCGQMHAHGVGEGHRVSHCEQHRPHGYHLLRPLDDEEEQS